MSSSTAGSARGYLRHPTIVGDVVVFSCADDLWAIDAAGGTAHRLTAGGTLATHPWLAPDGHRIAFTGTGDGPAEIYVSDLDGTTPRRLTFNDARCAVAGWHPDTGHIVFAATAGQPVDFGYRLFCVDPEGGPSVPLHHGPASAVAFGPDGLRVIGRSLADPARRKRYRGGAAGEFWIGRHGAFSPLPVPAGNVADPCWVDGRIYFVSDHDGVGHVWSMRPDGSDLTRHSTPTGFYARRLTGDGSRLVWSAGAQLFLLDPAEGHPRRIDVRVPGARARTARRVVTTGENLDEVRIGRDGELLLVVRGSAAAAAPWAGPVHRFGAGSAVRYRHLDRTAGRGRTVAVAADTAPGERLVALCPDGGPDETLLPLEDVGLVCELTASPCGDRVAFATNRQQLWVLDLAASPAVPRLVDQSPHERIEDIAWSPDGRWLAYSWPGPAASSSIRLADLDTGTITNITGGGGGDWGPEFDPCGRYLYFIGRRDPTPDHDQLHHGIAFAFASRPYLVTLRRDEPVPFDLGATADGPAQTSTRTDIDLDGIDARVVALPVTEARYAAVVALREQVLLLEMPVTPRLPTDDDRHRDGTVTVFDLHTGAVHDDVLDGVDAIVADAAGMTIAYRSGDRVRVLSAEQCAHLRDADDDVPGPATGWVDLGRVHVEVDPAAEWPQMVREAWRLQREGFWDEAMGGCDWHAAYERYAPLTGLIASRAELSDLLWELHGELASSHAYERDGDHARAPARPQGHLGVDLSVGADGTAPRWRIERIVRGHPWNEAESSPCGRPGCDVRVGDEVLAVDGRRVGRSGPDELLVGRAGHRVELTLSRPGAGTPHVVVVRAGADEVRARYLDWAASRRDQVHAGSSGRLGYLHIPDMTAGGYADFVRGMLAEAERDGLLVDVRGNGGGNASALLLDALARRPAGVEVGRWSGTSSVPPEAPRGPMALLVDEQSGSDAELFAHQFRDRELGLLLGRRTWGGTIATWPRHRLVDGTVTTQPEYQHLLHGVGAALENRGVEPDIAIAVPPDQDRPGSPDTDISAGIAHLMGLLTSAGSQPANGGVVRAATRHR